MLSTKSSKKPQTYFPLENEKNLDPLLERIGDAKYVLLGEASHGTHEYYTWRAQISKRLIKEKGFSFIAVEGDWPDCYKINSWVKEFQQSPETISAVLQNFKRWPTWMWGNWEIAAFATWLRNYNTKKASENKVGFYGLDVYSLWDSMSTIVEYLEKEDPQTAKLAKDAIYCFEPYKATDSYSSVFSSGKEDCRDEVLRLLQEVRVKKHNYDHVKEAGLNAEINALVMANAETYYKAMAIFGSHSWNVRDRHMVETLNTITNYHGDDTKVIVWAHNTHIGDASATDMAEDGLINIGQLIRNQNPKKDVVLVGFGTYSGSVIAGSRWGAPMQKMKVPEAKPNSFEYQLHQIDPNDKLLIFDKNTELKESFSKTIGQRAIGVVYNPDREYGNYVPSQISERYDAFVYLDKTSALNPLKIDSDKNKSPDVYPFGI